MDNIKEIKLLEGFINSGEIKQKELENNLKDISEELVANKKRLTFLLNGVKDYLSAGTKILFKDEDNFELTILLVIDYKGRYNAVLLTDYSNVVESMQEYYVFDYRCGYSGTLIECLENDYQLTFVKVI